MKQLYFASVFFATMAMLVCPSLCAEDRATTNSAAQRIELPGIHNAFRVTDKIFSGSQPEKDEAFTALAKLGVKTIVSVDGGKPDVETARKHGLRYIHLPFGYDSIPTNRVVQLTKLITEISGPFFVHCHHGLHRGPAAVAVMCEPSEGWTPARAEAWLREAGTSPDYPGLYRAAREFKPPTAAELAAIKELPEITKPSSLVETMVAIDEHLIRLKQSQDAGWITPPRHADISPSHEARLLWEQFRELARTEDTKKRPEDYQTKLENSERHAKALFMMMVDSGAGFLPTAHNPSIDARFNLVTRSCSACHRKYRNK